MIPAPPRPEHIPPSNVLMATGLPDSVQKSDLEPLFSSYPGFKEVRLVPGRGVAFVEFETDVTATPALQGLSNYNLGDNVFMALTYAKK